MTKGKVGHNNLVAKGVLEPAPKKGIVYTKPIVVNFLLDIIKYTSYENIGSQTLLDIGCGYGQFIGEGARRLAIHLHQNRLRSDLITREIGYLIRGIEIRPETATIARKKIIEGVGSVLKHDLKNTDWVKDIVIERDFLRWNSTRCFDLVVGNLPYIKYSSIEEALPGTTLEWLRDNFKSFRGRADYSVACIEHALKFLSDKGSLAVISSNRFVTSNYGKELRKILSNTYHIAVELDLSRTQPFTTAVSAYPSIFIIKRSLSKKFVYLSVPDLKIATLNRVITHGTEKVSGIGIIRYKHMSLPEDGKPWARISERAHKIIQRLQREYLSIDSLGFKIMKGSATGANDVFIKATELFEKEGIKSKKYLLPLFTTASLNTDLTGLSKALLNVYNTSKGELQNFCKLPADIRKYLSRHNKRLKERYIFRVCNRPWWSMIDSVKQEVFFSPKILIPDFHRLDEAVIDKNGICYPDHSVWVILKNERYLKAVQAWLKCPVSILFQLAYSSTLNGGTPRVSTVLLKTLPAPQNLEQLELFCKKDLLTATAEVFKLNKIEERVLKAELLAYMD